MMFCKALAYVVILFGVGHPDCVVRDGATRMGMAVASHDRHCETVLSGVAQYHPCPDVRHRATHILRWYRFEYTKLPPIWRLSEADKARVGGWQRIHRLFYDASYDSEDAMREYLLFRLHEGTLTRSGAIDLINHLNGTDSDDFLRN